MRLKLSSVKNLAIFSGSFALATTLALQGGKAQAQVTTDTWVPGTTGNWSTGGNWVGGMPPTSGTTTSLIFNSTAANAAYTATNDVANPYVLNSLTLNNTNAGATGIITLAGNQISFNGANPTLIFNGTGNTTVNNSLLFNATSVIGPSVSGAGTGLLTLGGVVTNGTTAAPANLSVNDTGGTVNFTGMVFLNPYAPNTTSDNQGGDFFATNGTVNVNTVKAAGPNNTTTPGFVTNNLFYVGDSIASVNTTTGAATGATVTPGNATLNINSDVTQNGRFSIGAFSGDRGTVNITGSSLFINNGADTTTNSANFFAGRLQLGGYGGSVSGTGVQSYGTANTTASAANLVLNNGNIFVHNVAEIYTNGSITATNNSIVDVTALADGNIASAGVGGISLTNSQLIFDGTDSPTISIIYSGNITGSGLTLYKQDNYTQILAGNNTVTGTAYEFGGVLAITNNLAANVNVSGTNQVPSTNSSSTPRFQTGTLNVTGTVGGNVSIGTGGQTGGNLSGTGRVGNIFLGGGTAGSVAGGTISPGGTATSASGVGSAGTLNATSLIWSSAASMNFDLNLASTTSGDDLLNLSSYFNKSTGDAAGSKYLFNFTTTGTFSGSPMTYNLVDFQTGTASTGGAAFAASDFTSNTLPNGLNGVFSFGSNGSISILQFTITGAAVPEPSALPFALAGLAPVGLAAFRRARRHAASKKLTA